MESSHIATVLVMLPMGLAGAENNVLIQYFTSYYWTLIENYERT